MCRDLPKVSEWNILVYNFAGGSVERLVLIFVVGRTLVIAVAVFPRAEQHQVAGHNFSSVFPLPALPILPARGLNLSFDVKLGAFGNVFADDLRQTLPGHDAVPFGPLLPFIVAVFESLVGGKAELSDGCAAGRIFHFGSLPTFPTRMTLFTLFGIVNSRRCKDFKDGARLL